MLGRIHVATAMDSPGSHSSDDGMDIPLNSRSKKEAKQRLLIQKPTSRQLYRSVSAASSTNSSANSTTSAVSGLTMKQGMRQRSNSNGDKPGVVSGSATGAVAQKTESGSATHKAEASTALQKPGAASQRPSAVTSSQRPSAAERPGVVQRPSTVSQRPNVVTSHRQSGTIQKPQFQNNRAKSKVSKQALFPSSASPRLSLGQRQERTARAASSVPGPFTSSINTISATIETLKACSDSDARPRHTRNDSFGAMIKGDTKWCEFLEPTIPAVAQTLTKTQVLEIMDFDKEDDFILDPLALSGSSSTEDKGLHPFKTEKRQLDLDLTNMAPKSGNSPTHRRQGSSTSNTSRLSQVPQEFFFCFPTEKKNDAEVVPMPPDLTRICSDMSFDFENADDLGSSSNSGSAQDPNALFIKQRLSLKKQTDSRPPKPPLSAKEQDQLFESSLTFTFPAASKDPSTKDPSPAFDCFSPPPNTNTASPDKAQLSSLFPSSATPLMDKTRKQERRISPPAKDSPLSSKKRLIDSHETASMESTIVMMAIDDSDDETEDHAPPSAAFHMALDSPKQDRKYFSTTKSTGPSDSLSGTTTSAGATDPTDDTLDTASTELYGDASASNKSPRNLPRIQEEQNEEDHDHVPLDIPSGKKATDDSRTSITTQPITESSDSLYKSLGLANSGINPVAIVVEDESETDLLRKDTPKQVLIKTPIKHQTSPNSQTITFHGGVPDMHQMLDRSMWKALDSQLKRIAKHPDLLEAALTQRHILPDETAEGNHSTPLHTVCWKAPPALTLKFLKILPRDNPEAMRNLGIAVDSEHNTPLHLCAANTCTSMSAPSATEALLRQTFEGSADITAKDPNDNLVATTLEDLELKKRELEVLSELIEVAPEALLCQNSQGDTPLHLAVSSPLASVDAVKLLLLQKQGIRACLLQDSVGQTPLHAAIANRAPLPVLDALLDAALAFSAESASAMDDSSSGTPAIVKLVDHRGLTLLHYIAAFCHTPLPFVHRIRDAYPEALIKATKKGDTPLHIFVANADHDTESTLRREILNLLLNSVPPSRSNSASNPKNALLILNKEKLNPLHCCAVFNAAPEITKQILKQQPLLAERALITTNAYGATPLHVAVAQPHVARSLATPIALGSALSINSKCPASLLDRLRRTPLHVAAQNKEATSLLIQFLTQLHPDAASVKAQRGHLPLHLAAQSQASESVVRALLKAYPKAASCQNKSGNTPLHDAAKYKAHINVVKLLTEAYPQALIEQNQYGNTPLHCATAYGASSSVISALLQANRTAAAMKNKNLDFPLHYASAYCTSVDVLEDLLEASPASIAAVNSSGQTPLQRAQTHPGGSVPSFVLQFLQQATDEYLKEVGHDSSTHPEGPDWAAF